MDLVVWAVRYRPPLQPYTPWARVSHVTAQLPSLDEVSYEAPGRASWFARFRLVGLRPIAELRSWFQVGADAVQHGVSIVRQHFSALVV